VKNREKFEEEDKYDSMRRKLIGDLQDAMLHYLKLEQALKHLKKLQQENISINYFAKTLLND